jgi:hypothetical protein
LRDHKIFIAVTSAFFLPRPLLKMFIKTSRNLSSLSFTAGYKHSLLKYLGFPEPSTWFKIIAGAHTSLQEGSFRVSGKMSGAKLYSSA